MADQVDYELIFRATPYAHACPRCAAASGHDCTTTSGYPCAPHMSRWRKSGVKLPSVFDRQHAFQAMEAAKKLQIVETVKTPAWLQERWSTIAKP